MNQYAIIFLLLNNYSATNIQTLDFPKSGFYSYSFSQTYSDINNVKFYRVVEVKWETIYLYL